MAEIYLHAPLQPVEVVRILDAKLDTREVEKLRIRLFEGVEHAYVYCKYRRIRKHEDGRRFVPICLKTEKDLAVGIQSRSVLEDEECLAHEEEVCFH